MSEKKNDNEGIPPLKKRGGAGITASEVEQAAEFNGQFTDVFNKNDHIEVPFLSRWPLSWMTLLFQMGV